MDDGHTPSRVMISKVQGYQGAVAVREHVNVTCKRRLALYLNLDSAHKMEPAVSEGSEFRCERAAGGLSTPYEVLFNVSRVLLRPDRMGQSI